VVILELRLDLKAELKAGAKPASMSVLVAMPF
jgi:hypothetical protein